MRLVLSLLFAACAAGQQARVSYSRDVAPILGLYCASCHSPDAWHKEFSEGFDISTYAGLMKGGKSGPAVVPGQPLRSLLIAKLTPPDGSEHEAMMPLFANPLTRAQQDTLKRWISEGATQDSSTPTYTFGVDGVPRPESAAFSGPQLTIECRLMAQGYMDLNIRDPETGKLLRHRQAAVKWRREWADVSAPGGWATWITNWEKSWPDKVDIELTVSHTEEPPYGTFFVVNPPLPSDLQVNDLIPPTIRLGVDPAGIFRFWLNSSADLDLTITGLKPRRTVFHDASQRALPRGQGYYKWPLKNTQKQTVQPGDYAACLKFKPLSGGPEYPVAVYFAVK